MSFAVRKILVVFVAALDLIAFDQKGSSSLAPRAIAESATTAAVVSDFYVCLEPDYPLMRLLVQDVAAEDMNFLASWTGSVMGWDSAVLVFDTSRGQDHSQSKIQILGERRRTVVERVVVNVVVGMLGVGSTWSRLCRTRRRLNLNSHFLGPGRSMPCWNDCYVCGFRRAYYAQSWPLAHETEEQLRLMKASLEAVLVATAALAPPMFDARRWVRADLEKEGDEMTGLE